MATVCMLTAFCVTAIAVAGARSRADSEEQAAPYLVSLALLVIGQWLRHKSGTA